MELVERVVHVAAGVLAGGALAWVLADHAPAAPAGGASAAATPAAARDAPPAEPGGTTEREKWRRERERLHEQLDDAEARVRAVTQARAEGRDTVVAENEKLRDEVRRLRDVQRALHEREQQQAGKAMAIPDSLPEAYRQEGLRASFVEALKEAGFHGDVRSIDCTEFPCVVYGDGNIEGGKGDAELQVKAMEEALKRRYPEGQHSMHESVWTSGKRDDDGTERQRIQFGISVYPKGTVDDATRDEVRKRLRWRQREYMDSQQE